MAIERDEAIVLGRTRFSETSLIVTLFTKRRGPLRLIAKGARKNRSRFAGVLEPTNHVHAHYYRKETRDLQLLSQCDVLTAFPRLRESLLRLAYGYAIIGALIGLKREETDADSLFRIALRGLEAVDGGPEAELEPALWAFLMAALADAGFRPELDRCLRCGRPLTSRGARFDARGGGLLCRAHEGGGLSLSSGTVEALRCLAGGEMPGRGLVRREVAEGRELFRRFLEEHGLGRSPFRPIEQLIPHGGRGEH
jgi:DNA repair protein RecO (recombination protein O)